MTSFNPPFPSERLVDFCHRWGIARLDVFGSSVRSAPSPGSDLDILVTFREGRTPTFFELQDMESELTLWAGRKVDLLTEKGISPMILEKVRPTAVNLYAG